MHRRVRPSLGWIACLAVNACPGFAADQHVDAPTSASTAPMPEPPATTRMSAPPADSVHRILLEQLALRPQPAPVLRRPGFAESIMPMDNALTHLQAPAPPGRIATLQSWLKRHFAAGCIKPADQRWTPYVALAKDTGLSGSTDVVAYKTWKLMNQSDARETVQARLQQWGVADTYVERGAAQFDAFREAPVARNAVVGMAGFAAFYNVAAWMDSETPVNACADQEGWGFLRHGQAFRLWVGALGLVLAIALYALLKKVGVLR